MKVLATDSRGHHARDSAGSHRQPWSRGCAVCGATASRSSVELQTPERSDQERS
jgi:hypothetical protein